MFNRNLDTSGRILRAVMATIILIYAGWAHSWLALLMAAFVYFEAVRGWCVFYQLIGKNSCPIDKEKK